MPAYSAGNRAVQGVALLALAASLYAAWQAWATQDRLDALAEGMSRTGFFGELGVSAEADVMGNWQGAFEDRLSSLRFALATAGEGLAELGAALDRLEGRVTAAEQAQ